MQMLVQKGTPNGVPFVYYWFNGCHGPSEYTELARAPTVEEGPEVGGR